MLGDEIYKRLLSTYTLDPEDFIAPRLQGISLFEFVVAVVLSQNTSDKNAWRAYTNLKSKLGCISPESIRRTRVEELAELIKVAGMHRERAHKLRELAEIFSKSDVEKRLHDMIERGDIARARKALLDLPGVGYKTTDVVLLMYYHVPTFPVDTHIARITRRLGYVKSSNYEEIRSFWMKNTTPTNYLPLHLLLIVHGRVTCKARKPLCDRCAIKDLCSVGRGTLA